MAKNIFFSVGEPSGDQHAARMITELRQIDPTVRVRGFGGSAMRKAGCHIDRDLTQHAVVGLLEVLPKLRLFFRFAAEAEAAFQAGQVDAVVLVDFPGFNWHIAKRAKRHGIPVYYYCPPQLWAWGGWRSRKMRRTVDHVLAVLPIEEAYFPAHGIPATYVGHPFFDAVQERQLDQLLMDRFAMCTARGNRLVAVLPGSRGHEVQQNWPMMMESIRRLHHQHPEVRFLVACYRDRQCLWCRKTLTEEDRSLPIEFFVDRTSEVIEASHCAMMVSGSVSLELMARRTPAAVIYRVGRFLHTVAKMMVKLDSITLPNLMNGRRVFPELVSVGSPEPGIDFLTGSVDAFLRDDFYYRRVLQTLDQLSQRYAKPGASARAAQWVSWAIGANARPVVHEAERRAAAKAA